MLNLVLFGPPGAGKGTQAEKLMAHYGLAHISTGDLFRAHIGKETELGQLAKSYMDQGNLVPDEVTIGMLRERLSEMRGIEGVIFDGFPRTVPQAEALDALLLEFETSVTAMVALEVDEEELKQRLLLRGKDSGRADDQNPEIIAQRIAVYKAQTLPVADFYAAQKKFASIEGMGSIDEVFARLTQAVDAAR